MADLLRDAQFYSLDGLVNLLEPSSLAVETEYRVYVSLPSVLVFPPLPCVAVRRGCPAGQVWMYGGDSIYLKEECNFISIGLRPSKTSFRFPYNNGVLIMGRPYIEVFRSRFLGILTTCLRIEMVVVAWVTRLFNVRTLEQPNCVCHS